MTRRRSLSHAATVRRALAALLALAAIAGGVEAAQGSAPETNASQTESRRLGRAVTPLWSGRRAPQPVADGAGAVLLGQALAAATAGTSSCAEVQDTSTGSTVVSIDPTLPLAPASTTKLLTATAALADLGVGYRYTTRVVGSSPRNGSVPQLVLVGGGDPVLRTPEGAAAEAAALLTRTEATTRLADLADAIVARGIRAVPGGIVADDSRYDTQRVVPQWPSRYVAEGDVGPLGALSVDGGHPVALDPDDTALGGPAVASDPGLLTAAQLTRLLAARGVSVGPPSRGTAPRAAPLLASVSSPPLGDILAGMLAASDNGIAELATKELAVHAGRPGTTTDGVAVTANTLTDLGLPTEGLVLVDGSGLAREDRATCALLDSIVALGTRARFSVLRTGLAVAGRSGTLATRLRGTALAGKLTAKTGSLNGVSALAGVMDLARPLRFAFVVNGNFPESTGIAVRERMATLAAPYPDLPPGPSWVPAPLASTATNVSPGPPATSPSSGRSG